MTFIVKASNWKQECLLHVSAAPAPFGAAGLQTLHDAYSGNKLRALGHLAMMPACKWYCQPMDVPETPSPFGSASADKAYAFSMLEALLTKRLTAPTWQHLEAVLSSMASAISRHDAEAFGITVGDLEIVMDGSIAPDNSVVTTPADSVLAQAAAVFDRLR